MPSTKKQANKFTIFDWFQEVTYNKTSWDSFSNEQKKSFEPYMINRLLSMNKDYLELINYIQMLPITDKEKYYKIYCGLVPKKKIWNKYIKSSSSSKNKELINYMTLYFECSNKEVSEYLDLLSKEQIKDILYGFGIDDKKIKEVLK
jgi:hypothetical protein